MAKIRITGYADGSSRIPGTLTLGKAYDVLLWDLKGLGIPWVMCDDGVEKWIVNSTWVLVDDDEITEASCGLDSLTRRIEALEKRVEGFLGKAN